MNLLYFTGLDNCQKFELQQNHKHTKLHTGICTQVSFETVMQSHKGTIASTQYLQLCNLTMVFLLGYKTEINACYTVVLAMGQCKIVPKILTCCIIVNIITILKVLVSEKQTIYSMSLVHVFLLGTEFIQVLLNNYKLLHTILSSGFITMQCRCKISFNS